MTDSSRRVFLQAAAGGAGFAARLVTPVVARGGSSAPPASHSASPRPAVPAQIPDDQPDCATASVVVPPVRRLGMIGLDTSHVPAFTKLFNQELADDPRLGGLRVVAGVKGGNPDFPLSRDRIEGFTREVEQLGVRIVPSIAELLPLVDGVLLQSVDGNQHLEQARPVLEAGLPVFIDKPLAASLSDAREIARLAEQRNVPWFTASSSRFTAGYPELRNNPAIGEILGCDTYSQSRGAPGHPDLFWYAIHGIDLLYSQMGPGCQRVTALQTPYTEQVTGVWRDGRVGCYRSIREQTGKTGLGATVFGQRGIAHVNAYYDYAALVQAIGQFFLQRKSPVATEEMLEVITFMAAAEESRRRQGAPVELAEVSGQVRAPSE